MSMIDERVVEMAFKNDKFSSGVTGTISMLDRLKASLKLDGASKGLDDVNRAAGQFNDKPVTDGVGRISASFSSMQAVAFGAFASIGQKAMGMATQLASSFTIDPMKAGFQEYELKMGSIQTILANTTRYGTTLDTVNAELEKLNLYADQTIYNFGDMTKNIGLFTNAGIRVEDATTMIKGFSNSAAASGTNAEGAAHAAEQLSQALSSGTVRAQDWISLTNVGMGNKNMQDGLIAIAGAMGTFNGTAATAKTASKGFKDSLQEGWLTADVMSSYLKIMSGDMDDASIAALGLNKEQVAMLRTQATMGIESAVKVRTFSQLMGTLKESVGSGWSETFGILFGDFNEATELFTNLNNSIGGFLTGISASRNKLLQEWKDMGGRAVLIDALGMAFKTLGSILAPIGQAFREVFPATTANQLMNLTKEFHVFIENLQPAPETLDRLKRTFAGLFALLGIGWEIIKQVAWVFSALLGRMFEGEGGFLKFTASIGDFLVSIHEALKSGTGLNNFFVKMEEIIGKPISKIREFINAIGNFFGSLDFGPAGDKLGDFINKLLNFGDSAESTGKKATSFTDKIKSVFDFIGNFASKVADLVQPFTDKIVGLFDDIDYDQVMKALQTGLLGGLVLVIKQLGGVLGKFSLFGKGDEGGGFLDNIKEGLESLSGTLKAMQANLKASALIKIAAAIGILALGVVLLAGVDAQGLIRASAALTVMFIQLGAAMAALNKMGGFGSAIKFNIMAAGMILMATAMLILAAAVKVLATMSWEELGKGLSAMIVLMGVIIGLSKGLDKAKGAIIRSALALIIMGAALKILVSVVEDLGDMDLSTMSKGLLGVGALLLGLAIFTRLAKSGPQALAQAASMVLLAIALKQLADVVGIFAAMSWSELAKGFAGIAGGLIAIGISLKFMPKGPKLLLTAFSIGKVAAAFGLIAMAFAAFKDISWDQIARGLAAITGSLLVVTGALKVMPKVNLMQVAGILLLAYAIKQIVSSLVLIGNMDMSEIGKSMLTFTGVMAIIVASLKLLGSKDSAQGAAAIAVVAGSMQMLQGVLTAWGAMDLESLAKGIGALAAVLAILVISLRFLKSEAAGAVALGIVAGALSLLIPVLVTLGSMPLLAIGTALVGLAGMFIILTLGLKLLQPMIPTLMLLAIAIGILGLAVALAGVGVMAMAVGLTLLAGAGAGAAAALVAIVAGLVGLIPMVMEQIGLGLVAFAGVIAAAGPAITEALVAVLTALLQAIIDITPKIIETLGVLLDNLIAFLLEYVPKLVIAGLQLLIALLDGIANNIGQVIDSAVSIIVNFLDGIARNLPRIIQAGVDLIIAFMDGIGQAVKDNGPRFGEAAANMAKNIIDGVVNGFATYAKNVLDALLNVVKGAWKAALDFLGISSPSKKFMEVGQYVVEGFAKGITGNSDEIDSAVKDMMDKVDDAMQYELDEYHKHLDTIADLDQKRIEKLRDIQNAAAELNAARNIQIRSTKKKAADRRDDEAKQQEAKNKKIQAATEKLHDLDTQYNTYLRNIYDEQQLANASMNEYNRLNAARNQLLVSLADEEAHLKDLADQRDANNQAIEDQIKVLEDATKTRDDYNKSLRDQYGAQADVNKETHLSDYVKDLQEQIVATQNFTIAIQELRKRGLNDELYQSLLAKGPVEAMPFVQELLAGGQEAVDDINNLGTALDTAAGVLGDDASTSMYQAGVDAADGLLQGLQSKGADIQAQMDQIAQYMVDSLNRALGIKSPSRVFAEVGGYAAAGLVNGLKAKAPEVGQAAEDVGQSAIDAMRKTISGLGAAVNGDLDMNPVIAPVLDLSNVRRDASLIGAMLGTQPLDVDTSRARAASAGYAANQATADAATNEASAPISFVQNNYSPKALSHVELYRQTNNQISVAKGALTSNAR